MADLIAETSSTDSTNVDVKNTSTGGKWYRWGSMGSGVGDRTGHFEVNNITGGIILAYWTPDGKLVLTPNTAAIVGLEVPIHDAYGAVGDIKLGTAWSGTTLFGRTSPTTLNDPDPSITAMTRGYTVDLNDFVFEEGVETMAVLFDQVLFDQSAGATSEGERAINGEWKDYEIRAGGGANIATFRGLTLVTASTSDEFEGSMYGAEFDTFVDVPEDEVTVSTIWGPAAYSGPNRGEVTVAGDVFGAISHGCNNGTGNVDGFLVGHGSRIQLGGNPGGASATHVAHFFADNVTVGPAAGASLGTVSGNYAQFWASRGSTAWNRAKVEGGFYAFYSEATSDEGADVFNSRFGGGGWQNGHVIWGDYHKWVDAQSIHRYKGGVPASDGDGIPYGAVQPIVSKSSNYSASRADHTILVDTTAAARTITLPTGADVETGHLYVVKLKAGANNVTVNAASGTLDGAANKIWNTSMQSFRFQFDGTNYWIV